MPDRKTDRKFLHELSSDYRKMTAAFYIRGRQAKTRSAGFTNFEPRRRVVDFGEGFSLSLIHI